MSVARRAAVLTIMAMAVAPPACNDEPPPLDQTPNIAVPPQRGDAEAQAADVLEPVEASAADADVDAAQPDALCTEPNLVGCWPFEGAVDDESPSALVPELLTDAAFDVGKKGQALKLGGDTQIVFGAEKALDLTVATVEAWAWRDVVSFGDDTVFDDDQRFTATIEQDGTLRCSTAATSARGGNVPIAKWMHIACVFDGTTIRAYVNGAEVGSAAGRIGAGASAGAAIGDNAPDGGQQFDGMIDSLRVFSVARTAAQIAAAAK